VKKFLDDNTLNNLESEMTVCVATICEKGKFAMIASDRMFTSGIPLFLELEHNIPKITKLTNYCAAAISGDVDVSTELFELAKTKIDFENATVSEVGKRIYDAFFELRLKKMEEDILRPRGIRDFEEYYERQQQLASDVVWKIEEKIDEFVLDLQVLVAGVEENGAHVYCIEDPCRFTAYDARGYHAIGIGASHALTSLKVQGYDKDSNLSKALMRTYEAKKIAERAPGVGKETNLMILPGGNMAKAEHIKVFDELYQQKVNKILEVEQEWEDYLDTAYKEITKGE
jgi:20S proteasome alpha/beta subunit